MMNIGIINCDEISQLRRSFSLKNAEYLIDTDNWSILLLVYLVKKR